MGEFHRDLDYLVDVNVREEAYLYELLTQHRAEWPEISDAEALGRLQVKLLERLRSGGIGIYIEKWAEPTSRRDLSVTEAASAIGDTQNWLEPSTPTEWFHYVYEAG
jgi:hypothetical protein